MQFRVALLLLALAGLLAGAVYVSFSMWTSVDGGGQMNGVGTAALVMGGIGSLVVGGGLMALMFFSSRRGYDDAADLKSRRDKD